jgi:hypothetical protein
MGNNLCGTKPLNDPQKQMVHRAINANQCKWARGILSRALGASRPRRMGVYSDHRTRYDRAMTDPGYADDPTATIAIYAGSFGWGDKWFAFFMGHEAAHIHYDLGSSIPDEDAASRHAGRCGVPRPQ